MSVNLNNTTPAAPAFNKNVLWQQDASGNISAYVPTSAQEVAAVDLLAQAANIGSTILFTPTAAGLVRIIAHIIVSQAATTSSTLPSITITWTDADNSTAQSITLTPTNAGNLLTTLQQASALINAKASTNISYTTAGYASVGATPMQYAIHLKAEQM